MKLNQYIYVVDDSGYIIKGNIQSIQKITYTHHEYYGKSGEIETTELNQYSVHGNSGWYYSDKCFNTEKEAKQHLLKKLEEKKKDVEDRIRWLK